MCRLNSTADSAILAFVSVTGTPLAPKCQQKKKVAKPFSNFDIGGPQTEIIQLVHVASLAGQPIEYDPLAGKIRNVLDANVLFCRDYREGWTL